jgi:aerobic-type carbon monoxide dehydrogenase small subunit (CoxS/CutS family)
VDVPPLTLTVNGRAWSGEVRSGATLLELVREHIGLSGAKLGCGEGRCGSCTVLVDGRAVSACSTPAASASGRTLVTIEGLASGDRLHPLQQAFIDKQAFQCGFCTPGMILGAAALLSRQAAPGEREIRQALDGHLCRCGTYPRIVEAVRAASEVITRERRRG